MGIRFYCPNGHKMNVKDYQAGQRGICPTCGAKMQIPLESTRPSSRRKKSRSASTSSEPQSFFDEPNLAKNPLSSAATVFDASPESDPLDATVFAASPEVDPLDATDNVVWYVQPPTGRQLGPATADIVHSWLDHGRLTADCLIWREGWSEWKKADDVFPQLAPKLIIPGLEAFLGEPAVMPLHGRATESHAPSNKLQLIAWGTLAMVLLILLVTSLLIWLKQ
jgi:hypothetical protein